MKKFAIVLFTAAMTFGSTALYAAESGSNNGSENQAAESGNVAPGAKQNIQPNHVDNSKINTGEGVPHTGMDMNHDKKMSADEINKNTECKDGKCPDINNKVGHDADHKTDGTSQ